MLLEVGDCVLLLLFNITEITGKQTLSTSEGYCWNMYVALTTHSSHVERQLLHMCLFTQLVWNRVIYLS